MPNANDFLLETSDLSKELSLLLDIMVSRSLNESHFVDVDWKEFIALALHHRLYPSLYMKLKEYSHCDIPSNVIDTLHNKYSTNVMSMLHLSSELEKINIAFLESNIESILLKGPVLALKLYGDISLRTSKDLDILVSPDHITKAEEILSSLGYMTTDQKLINTWKRKNHHISYFHKVTSTQVELHWRMSSELPGASFKELWERKITVALSSSPINYLSNEDLFVYLVSHGARHGWFRLRWLYDIDRMISKELINTKKLNQIYNRYGGQYLAGQAIILSAGIFSTKVPNELKSLTHHKRSHKLARTTLFFVHNKIDFSSQDDKSNLNHHKRYLYSLMSNKQKLSLAIDYLYPSSKDVLLFTLPKSLYFLYFPLRPFLWFWRYLKRESMNNEKSI